MSACQLVETASRDFVIGLGYKIVNFNLFSRRNVKDSKNRVSHDLALRADISFRNQSALCRDIQQGFAQATNGNKALKISCSADYTLSRLLTLRLYYDRQQNTPTDIFQFVPGCQCRLRFQYEILTDSVNISDGRGTSSRESPIFVQYKVKQHETIKNLHEALVSS